MMREEAAEEVASYASIDKAFATLDRRFDLLIWMVGFNNAMTLAVLWLVFSAHG